LAAKAANEKNAEFDGPRTLYLQKSKRHEFESHNRMGKTHGCRATVRQKR